MLEDFYKILEEKETMRGFDVRVALNREHLIYKAHFPDNPITPGVCLLQMCQELVAGHCGGILRMTGAKNVKFLNVLNPLEYGEVVFSVVYEETKEGVKASVVICNEVKEFAKVSVEYIKRK